MVSPFQRRLNGLLAGDLWVSCGLTDQKSKHHYDNDHAGAYTKPIFGTQRGQARRRSHADATHLNLGFQRPRLISGSCRKYASSDGLHDNRNIMQRFALIEAPDQTKLSPGIPQAARQVEEFGGGKTHHCV